MIISKTKFFEFISKQYKVSAYEEYPESYNSQYVCKMTHLLRFRERFYMTMKYILKYLRQSTDSRILDLGVYPGTMIRLLRQYLPESKFTFYGAGLGIEPDFVDMMMKETGATIKTINLDPKSEALRKKDYPTLIPIEDNSIDFVFALEIIEHLVSPFHMLSEANRVLKNGGYIFLTTPNVTRIGSVFKLLVGKSNFDRLHGLKTIDKENHWHSHFREYSMDELTNFLEETGFEVVEKIFFIGDETQFNVKTLKQKLIDLAKTPFHLVPHLRGNLLIIGKKSKNLEKT